MCAWHRIFALVTAIAHSTPPPTGRRESGTHLAEFYETATLAFEVATTDSAHLASLEAALNFGYDVPLELIPRTANFLNGMRAQIATKQVIPTPGILDDAFVDAVEFSLSNTRLLAATDLDPNTSVEIAQHFAAIESVLIAAQAARGVARKQAAREQTQELNSWQLCVVVSAVLGGLALTIGVCILGLKLRQRRRRRKRLEDLEAQQRAIAETQRLDMIVRMNEALETMENV
ncbi:MAG: hypothetical protein KVP17_004544 [Porospora cf. gigantea B]|uniref:uncharacterized protein n=1 Tax=Porospora cf. gigantea B TaxID=2853592 RepID=UPI003571CBB6|nr:MAG: hypothetical protein KVP17_004544 [Porospora cf. gigantea B]